jgi:hypothetical protein
MTTSPYILYASNYAPFKAETNGSYLGSVQGGNVYAGETQPDVAYGNYSSPGTTLAETQFYNIQFQWLVGGGNVKDQAYVTVLVPGSGTTFTSLTPIDISQSGNLLIQMGNTYTQSDNPAGTVGGNATTFTVVLNNDTSGKQDGSGQTGPVPRLPAAGVGRPQLGHRHAAAARRLQQRDPVVRVLELPRRQSRVAAVDRHHLDRGTHRRRPEQGSGGE